MVDQRLKRWFLVRVVEDAESIESLSPGERYSCGPGDMRISPDWHSTS